MHCGQLILTKIGKVGASRCQNLRLDFNALNLISAGAPLQTLLGKLAASPTDLPAAVFKELTSEGREAEGEKWAGR